MRAIAILSEEHRLLFQVLHCLENLLQETAQDDRLDGEAAAGILEFLERFADGCHQDKEEEFLFPRLLAATPATVQRTIHGLLSVHEEERRAFEELRHNFEAAAYGDPWSLDLFVRRAGTYVALQRRHAWAEDSGLFPLAVEFLGDRADREMVEGFDRLDSVYRAHGGAEPRLLVARLCTRFGVGEEAQEVSADLAPDLVRSFG